MSSTENLTVINNNAIPLHEIVSRRIAPGLIVFAEGMQLVHLSEQAAEYCQELHHRNATTGSVIEIPVDITALCDEIRLVLQRNSCKNKLGQVQVSRIISHIARPILLRGFALPDIDDAKRSLILVMLERIGHHRKSSIESVKYKFRLTEREECVVCQLAKGQTNKEIARTLSIAEETVKQHIKNIMGKTKATTRTAILAKVLHE